MHATIQDMIGRIFVSVENKDNTELIFTDKDGNIFTFYHDQDCCEDVYIADITGELGDLVGTVLTFADISTSNEAQPHQETDEWTESFTWTFYKFATIKGWVDVRWFGTSNGYYSEGVDLMYKGAEDV